VVDGRAPGRRRVRPDVLGGGARHRHDALLALEQAVGRRPQRRQRRQDLLDPSATDAVARCALM
jgi:hypothetical protein